MQLLPLTPTPIQASGSPTPASDPATSSPIKVPKFSKVQDFVKSQVAGLALKMFPRGEEESLGETLNTNERL